MIESFKGGIIMEIFDSYIVPVIVGICLCIGYVIKNLVSTDKVNKFIPTIVAALGVFLAIWMNKFKISPEILLQGLVSGLSSTGLYELFTQYIENKN